MYRKTAVTVFIDNFGAAACGRAGAYLPLLDFVVVMKKNKFGDRLNQILKERQISKQEFAKNINVVPSTVSGYLNNSREPCYMTLADISRDLNISSDYLIGVQELKDLNNELLSERENMLIEIYRGMDVSGQLILEKLAFVLFDQYS